MGMCSTNFLQYLLLLVVHTTGITQVQAVSVSVVPAEITVIDFPPSNNFTLTCSATSASATAATKTFTWSKQALGSTSSRELIHNGGSIFIVTYDAVSTLMTSETQSGGYVYTCNGRIGDGDASTDMATVNVRGPSVPDAPTNLHSTVNSFSTATISWTVSRVAYTPETYTVVYGTDQSNLNQRSTTVTGVSGTASYSVELAQLQHGTRYYFQVESTNNVGSTHSTVASFEVQNTSGQQLSQFIYLGSGLGGGVGVVVLFIIILLIILCYRRCRKKRGRYPIGPPHDNSIVMRDNNFYVTRGATRATPYELHPRKMHPQISDTYISMNPARAAVPEFSSRPPPPQYEATIAMAADNEKLYDEIPGERLTPTFSEEQRACDDNQYVSIPSSSAENGSEVTTKPQDADKEDTNDPKESENAYVMDEDEMGDPNECENSYVMD